MNIHENLGTGTDPDVVPDIHLADQCPLLADQDISGYTMTVIDDLYVGADQYIVANSNQVFRRDDVASSDDSVVSYVNLGVGKRQLKEAEVLDGAMVAELQHSTLGQSELGRAFDHNACAGARQVSPYLVGGYQPLEPPPRLRYDAMSSVLAEGRIICQPPESGTHSSSP